MCTDLTGTCDPEIAGATGRDVLLGYTTHANRAHRQDPIAFDAVITAILDEQPQVAAGVPAEADQQQPVRRCGLPPR